MSFDIAEPATARAPAAAPARPALRRRSRSASQSSLLARGEPMLWITGGALALALAMIVGLVGLILWKGSTTFWPPAVIEVKTLDGQTYLGEVAGTETYRPGEEVFDALEASIAAQARLRVSATGGVTRRRQLRTGNFELTGTHYQWLPDFLIAQEQSSPPWPVVVERLTWGRFYGTPKSFVLDGQVVGSSPSAAWAEFQKHHAEVRRRWRIRRRLETHDIGQINAAVEQARLDMRKAEMAHGPSSAEHAAAQQQFHQLEAESHQQTEVLQEQIQGLDRINDRYQIVMQTADGQEATLRLADIVRAYPANQLTTSGRLRVYAARWWEFLSDEPREANSEGGVFPAIFGTVVMTLVMSMAVVPFGVLAALYLREYARRGPIVSAVRIAINNLAGVPSIVFGVFGLGFFCYVVGDGIDALFFPVQQSEGTPTFGKGALIWASLTLALMTLPVVIVATEEALAAVPGSMREGSYACGASKWQTIRRIVLPRALPGIMTGMILAMARGAGEVAPLMLVGAVKLAPELPFAFSPPFGVDRSFLHLGFHIFDLGFQSQNSEAAKPMVFTTTLLLIAIIAILNITAVWLRARLRRRFVSAQF
jgi:phosphate transport system permease protein